MKTLNEIYSAYPSFKDKFDNDKLHAALESTEERVRRATVFLTHLVAGNKIQLSDLYVGHSGGKDSVVAHFVARSTFPAFNFPVVHTTKVEGEPNFTHPETVKFLYWLARHYNVIYRPLESEVHPALKQTVQIDGTRLLEAERSDGRSTDLVFNGEVINRRHMSGYNPKGLFGKQFLYPIFDWTDTEVWAAILWYNLPFSDEYQVVSWTAES